MALSRTRSWEAQDEPGTSRVSKQGGAQSIGYIPREASLKVLALSTPGVICHNDNNGLQYAEQNKNPWAHVNVNK